VGGSCAAPAWAGHVASGLAGMGLASEGRERGPRPRARVTAPDYGAGLGRKFQRVRGQLPRALHALTGRSERGRCGCRRRGRLCQFPSRAARWGNPIPGGQCQDRSLRSSARALRRRYAVDQQKTRAERHAEREAELERQDRESSAALARISLAQRLGVRPEDLTEEQLAASDLQAAPRQPVRFPSAPDVRRQILEAIATTNDKYATLRPGLRPEGVALRAVRLTGRDEPGTVGGWLMSSASGTGIC
jgi:hypothetical protein